MAVLYGKLYKTEKWTLDNIPQYKKNPQFN